MIIPPKLEGIALLFTCIKLLFFAHYWIFFLKEKTSLKLGPPHLKGNNIDVVEILLAKHKNSNNGHNTSMHLLLYYNPLRYDELEKNALTIIIASLQK